MKQNLEKNPITKHSAAPKWNLRLSILHGAAPCHRYPAGMFTWHRAAPCRNTGMRPVSKTVALPHVRLCCSLSHLHISATFSPHLPLDSLWGCNSTAVEHGKLLKRGVLSFTCVLVAGADSSWTLGLCFIGVWYCAKHKSVYTNIIIPDTVATEK